MRIAKRCVACDGADLARRPAVLMPFLALRVFGWECPVVDASWGLRDVPQGHALPVCGSVLCHACGMLFLDMRFDDEEMAALYTGYHGADYSAMRARFEPSYPARNTLLLGEHAYIPEVERFIAPHLSGPPRVLDWGGDTGRNTPFRDRATLHHVHDISGEPVIAGARAVTPDEARATPYDLVVSSNVLEHVPDPRALLRDIAAVMRPHTLLYVEVPHEDAIRLHPAPERLARKRHWHEHVNFFSEAALDRLLDHAGLRLVERLSRPVEVAGREVHVFSLLIRPG